MLEQCHHLMHDRDAWWKQHRRWEPATESWGPITSDFDRTQPGARTFISQAVADGDRTLSPT
jgi:hypothetical protein